MRYFPISFCRRKIPPVTSGEERFLYFLILWNISPLSYWQRMYQLKLKGKERRFQINIFLEIFWWLLAFWRSSLAIIKIFQIVGWECSRLELKASAEAPLSGWEVFQSYPLWWTEGESTDNTVQCQISSQLSLIWCYSLDSHCNDVLWS